MNNWQFIGIMAVIVIVLVGPMILSDVTVKKDKPVTTNIPAKILKVTVMPEYTQYQVLAEGTKTFTINKPGAPKYVKDESVLLTYEGKAVDFINY